MLVWYFPVMDYSQTEPAPFFRRVRYEPELRESEQYPTLHYNSPPVPPFVSLLPKGLVGYEEAKKAQMAEAKHDRKSFAPTEEEQAKHWVFIMKLAVRFPQVAVQTIAQELDPFDLEQFKSLVVEAQTRYLEELT
jgi:hypothetical protein